MNYKNLKRPIFIAEIGMNYNNNFFCIDESKNSFFYRGRVFHYKRLYQSDMTKKILDDLINKNKCYLTNLSESILSHEVFFKEVVNNFIIKDKKIPMSKNLKLQIS